MVAAATCDRCSSWTGGPRCLSGKPTGGGEPKGDCIGCSATTSSPSSSTLGCAGCGCSLPAEPKLVLLHRGLDAGSGLHTQYGLHAQCFVCACDQESAIAAAAQQETYTPTKEGPMIRLCLACHIRQRLLKAHYSNHTHHALQLSTVEQICSEAR